uniref:Agenet-like domain-containing protein n=1 Tax=Medicago truncatula TaxID=3880 RepID=I3T3J9_MEDTR|nr:unknown [Medicago truncatula]
MKQVQSISKNHSSFTSSDQFFRRRLTGCSNSAMKLMPITMMGGWEGHITEELEDGRFAVYFRVSKEQIVFNKEELRLHREWMHEKWVPPFQQQDDSDIKKKVTVKVDETVTEENVDFEVKPGTLVEVCSDEEGFKGAWFSATLVEVKGRK